MKYKGYEIDIQPDVNPENPRDWDNLSTMICFHGRYDLGDKHSFKSPEELQEFLAEEKPPVLLPLYLYDHGNTSISTKSFIGRAQHAEWDSGKIGYIYVTRDKLLKEYSAKKITAKLLAQATKTLQAEVATYDQFLNGEVYNYTIEDVDGDLIDSCGGYFGEEEVLTEAKSIVDNRPKYVKAYDGPITYEDQGW